MINYLISHEKPVIISYLVSLILVKKKKYYSGVVSTWTLTYTTTSTGKEEYADVDEETREVVDSSSCSVSNWPMSSSWEAIADGENTNTWRVRINILYYQRRRFIKFSRHNKHTCVVPFYWSDRNGLQCFFQEVQQTGADDHFLW